MKIKLSYVAPFYQDEKDRFNRILDDNNCKIVEEEKSSKVVRDLIPEYVLKFLTEDMKQNKEFIKKFEDEAYHQFVGNGIYGKNFKINRDKMVYTYDRVYTDQFLDCPDIERLISLMSDIHSKLGYRVSLEYYELNPTFIIEERD